MAEKSGYFNVHKYTGIEKDSDAGKTAAAGTTSFVSPSDLVANMDMQTAMVVSFRHEPSGQDVYFKAFVTTLNESFSSDWTEETVYGRTDAIQLFRQTQRRITLGLKVPAETKGEAYDNLARVGRLTQFLYPSHSSLGQAQTITQGPILRMKVLNLIRSVDGTSMAENGSEDPDGAPAPGSLLTSYTSNPDSSKGLLGIITSLSINHNLETPDVGLLHHGKNTILSTNIELNIDFTVIHETPLTWSKAGSFSVETFPYGAISMADADAAAQQAALNSHRQPESVTTEAAVPTEQEIMAAKKRYLMMGGEGRLKRDLIYLKKMEAKGNELKMAQAAMARGEEGAAKDVWKLERELARNASRMEYVGSTVRGAGIDTSSVGYTKKDYKAVADSAYDEFIK